MRRWLRRYREAHVAAGLRGGAHDVPPSPIRPATAIQLTKAAAAAEFEDYARRGVAAVEDETRNANTDAAYSPKVFQYFEFADYTHSTLDEATRYLVSRANIFGYVWYHAFRAKRATGGKKTGKRKRCSNDVEPSNADAEEAPQQRFLHFKPEEYKSLCTQH